MDYNFEKKEKEQISDDLPAVVHDFNEDKILQGYFKRMQKNVGENQSNAYVFEVSDGVEVGVWGTTQLDRLLKDAKEGQAYEIEFVESIPLKSKPENTFKKFKVSLLK